MDGQFFRDMESASRQVVAFLREVFGVSVGAGLLLAEKVIQV